MRASVVSRRSRVTRTSSAPRPLMVPANTSSPGAFSAGSDSPVTGAWLTALCPATTSPSSGIFSPGRTTITAPGAIRSTATRRSPSASRTSASAGVRSIRARMAWRARSSVRASSACASAKRNTTAAASDHSPSMAAPVAAMTMRTLNVERAGPRGGPRFARGCTEPGRQRDHEQERNSAYGVGRMETRRPRPLKRQPDGEGNAGGPDQDLAYPRPPIAADDRLLVLEPRAHAGVGDGVGDDCGRKLRRVVFHVQPLAHEVSREILEPDQVLEPPLENGDLLAAVHAFDPEGRFGVELAHRADGAHGRLDRLAATGTGAPGDGGTLVSAAARERSCTCSSPCANNHDVVVVRA